MILQIKFADVTEDMLENGVRMVEERFSLILRGLAERVGSELEYVLF